MTEDRRRRAGGDTALHNDVGGLFQIVSSGFLASRQGCEKVARGKRSAAPGLPATNVCALEGRESAHDQPTC